ncbi:MAG: hypothetical protein ACWIPJ_02775 [Polaribacter sp.]
MVAISCTSDKDVLVSRNLQEYIAENPNLERDNVIAYAANAKGNTSISYIFYYPIEGARNIRYYETEDATANEKDFSNYKRNNLKQEDVFGGKLERFVRTSDTETWCLVTFVTDGKLHISKPIRLKSRSKPTEYSKKVTIDYPTTLEPIFTWEDGTYKDNNTYFQVISDEENNFISGTYTTKKTFTYNDKTDIVLDINTKTPKALEEDKVYNFTMLGISEDNWVNLFIEKQFIPRNLEEYKAVNKDKTQDTLLAFAGNANGNKNETYIYYYPTEGAFDFRYYQTKNTTVDKNDFSNYSRKKLTSTAVFGGKLKRFTNESSDEVWCVVTFVTEGKLHISPPIKTKNTSKTTEWTTDVDITYPETLKPKFTWADGLHAENEKYLQVITDKEDVFLFGTFTTDKTFEYNSKIKSSLDEGTSPDLNLDAELIFSLYGISKDNWVNLVIKKTFIVE